MNADPCRASSPQTCVPGTCHARCAPDAIDELLRQPGAISGEDMDQLLELRWHLRRRTDAEAALGLFCDLRRRIEGAHYLALFRIRRWLENHVVVSLQSARGEGALLEPLRLAHARLDAVRRAHLCSARARGFAAPDARVIFSFRPVSVPESVTPRLADPTPVTA